MKKLLGVMYLLCVSSLFATTVEVRGKDQEKILIKQGDTLKVILGQAQGIPYAWQPSSLPAGIVLVSEKTRQLPVTKPVVVQTSSDPDALDVEVEMVEFTGGPVDKIFELSTASAKKGDHTLVFDLASFIGQPSAQTVKMTVKVQ